MLTRRDLLGNMLKVSASLMLAPDAIGLAEEISPISLRLAGGSPVEIPANFIGLGYEMSSVAMPSLLRATNHRYVELIRGLGTEGVLRIGGIVANYTSYKPNGTVKADRKNTVVTRATVNEFAAFLRKIGWTAIWSVNFAQGTIAEAVEEARAVSDVLGSRLLAVEIGNEVNSYAKSQPFRLPSYNYETYLKEYKEWHAAIVKAVPGIRFAAPDTTSGAEDWVERMAQDAKGDVQLLTSHYYRNGQARGTAEQLLTPDPNLADILARLRTASQQSAIPWRMCEINSFSGGGRPGVSDTFVDALWTLNTMLLLAKYGCAGVNMETGVNQLGFISSYSPIQDDSERVNSAAAPYYGMLAFARAFAGCHQMLPLEIGIQNEFLTAYVLGAGGKPRSVVVVNTDRGNDAQISVAGLGMNRVSVLRLIAPSAESKTGVSFAGATVDETGRWKAMKEERMQDGMVAVPRMSATVLRSADWAAHL